MSNTRIAGVSHIFNTIANEESARINKAKFIAKINVHLRSKLRSKLRSAGVVVIEEIEGVDVSIPQELLKLQKK